MTIREAAAAAFKKNDRVRTPDGREGVVESVNVYAAAIVTVYLDGAINLSPWLYFDLENISRSCAVFDTTL